MDPEAIAALSCGSRFYRADLHIHSYGASHDVTDQAALPENIVDSAVAEGLSIIAIADHNEIMNIRAAVAAGISNNLLVVPGVELSTPEGHLLCYVPTADALERFYNRLSVVQRRTPQCRCQTGTVECLHLLHQEGGFAILAHVDGPGSFEENLPRFTPAKLDILCHDALLGIEVTRADCPIRYDDKDADADRRTAAQTRIDRRKLGSKQFLARVLNSDAHTIAAVGRNARHDNRITRYKMEQPSFDGLRIALEEADTRVRIEDEVPRVVPVIQGAHFDGGFLADQAINFSPNLTCIIGGRGSGKSMAFEALRLLSDGGSPEAGSVVDSDVWPDSVSLFYRDETGEQHILSRVKNGDVENVADSVTGPVSFPIESYRQGETHTISKKAKEDPLALLTFLDRLIAVEQAINREDQIRVRLNELNPEIEKARKYVSDIPACERDVTFRRGQIQRLKKDRGEEVIRLQQQLEAERRTRTSIGQALLELQGSIGQQAVTDVISNIRQAANQSRIQVGAPEVNAILTDTATYESSISAVAGTLGKATEEYTSRVRTQLAAWKAKETKTTEAIETKKKELLAAGIRLDMPSFRN